jgi:hypothetical protein
MGQVGLWGEWWGSDSGWTTDRSAYGSCSTVQNYINVAPAKKNDRDSIIMRVLNHLPEKMKLTLRYPRDKRAFVLDNAAGTDALPLSISEAHKNTPKARIGFHNDSVFTGGIDEQNTFFACTDPAFVQAQIDWQSQDALYVPQAGETGCPYDPVLGSCSVAMTNLAKRRFDVLNRGWCPETLQAWKDQGCYDEIAAKLGYHLRMNTAAITNTTIKPGGIFSVTLDLTNDGYGKIYNPRGFGIVLRNKQNGTEYFLNALAQGHDPRLWLPGVNKTLTVTGGIPRGMPDGVYDVFVFLPDSDPSLRKRSIYAIRFANQNVWEESTGYNSLLASISISINFEGDSYTDTHWFSVKSADLNGDGIVNSLDWSIMKNKWGTSDAAADINRDGVANTLDWSIMKGEWGRSTT